jgi:hypothetical protein
MTAVTYAVILSLLWAMLQALAVLRLPTNWALWSSIPHPAISVSGLAAFLTTLAPVSESHAATALLAPVVLLYLAFLSFSWDVLRGA